MNSIDKVKLVGKIISWATLVATGIVVGLMIIAACLFYNNGRDIFICLASCGIFFLSLKYNIFALKRDRCNELLPENNAFLLVSAYLIFYFISHFVDVPWFIHYPFYGLLAAYLVFIVIIYIRKRKERRMRRMR